MRVCVNKNHKNINFVEIISCANIYVFFSLSFLKRNVSRRDNRNCNNFLREVETVNLLSQMLFSIKIGISRRAFKI